MVTICSNGLGIVSASNVGQSELQVAECLAGPVRSGGPLTEIDHHGRFSMARVVGSASSINA